MHENSAEEYRRKARRARALAESMWSDRDRDALHRAAAEFEALARAKEQSE